MFDTLCFAFLDDSGENVEQSFSSLMPVLFLYYARSKKRNLPVLSSGVVETILLMQMPVMIAVDDYNILYSHANYHEWMNEVHRRQLQPHELRLVSALRHLEQQVRFQC